MSPEESRVEILDIIEQLQDHTWMLGELQMQIAELTGADDAVAAMARTIRELEAVSELIEARGSAPRDQAPDDAAG